MPVKSLPIVNIIRPGQNDISKCIFLKENFQFDLDFI